MEDKRDLENEVYKSKLRFHTTAMITDNGSDDKKSQGILLTVPLFPAGMKMHLKNVKLVTSAVNTCKSQTAITAVDGEIYNRKYTLELQEAFNNLLNKLANLEKQVQSCDNKKYTLEDINKVRQFLNHIKEKIGNNEDKIATKIYDSNMSGTDLLATLDRISSNKFPTWALAFAGHQDADTNGLVKDNRKRNPVDVFFGDSVSTKNGSGLKTLIGSYSLEYINEQFKSKLKDKDFSKELRDSSIERNYGYNYFLCYFVQALLQIVLIDNEEILTSMDCAIIKSNWDRFLKELSNPYLKDMFDEYKPDKIEDDKCPYKFVDFMLNKLLGKDLIKKLEIDNARCKNYAEGSISISKSLSEADHANQIITMGFEHNSDNFTYDNSLFIGQGEFVYTPIYKAYKNMDNDLKRKLRLLAFELKTKKIKLDQSEYTTSDEYKFGRIQEVKYQYKTVSKDGKNELIRDGITDIKYKVPNDYDTDISAEDLMDLVLKVQNIEKDFNDKLQEAISAFDKDKTNSFLDVLIEFQRADICLSHEQINLILKNNEITEAMFNVVNKQDCNPKYINVYSWFINSHENVVESIDIKFLKLDLLTADSVCILFKKKIDQKNNNFGANDKADLLLKFWENNMFNDKLIKCIDSDIIRAMFNKDKECTNKIIIKFLNQFDNKIISDLILADNNLSDNTFNEIFYNKHQILSKEQISKINCSKLNALSIDILFENHLLDISQENVNTFSDIALKKLTPLKLIELLSENSNLNFNQHINWLQKLYLNDLYPLEINWGNFSAFVIFVGKHIEYFSREQILSLRRSVFTYDWSKSKWKPGWQKTNALNDCNKNVLAKLTGIEETGTELEKNIVKIMRQGEFRKNPITMQLAEKTAIMMVFIYQKSHDNLKGLLSYLIKNNEAFAFLINLTFYRILNFVDNKCQKDIFSNYESMYEKLSEDDKKECKKLNENDLLDCCQKMKTMLEDVLKEDKDPQNPDQGKNINYLCLSKLPWLTDDIIKLQDLSELLSDEQIQSVNISHNVLALENLYSLLDRFGNKLTYEQFHNLISNFNNTKTVLLNNSAPNNGNNQSLGILAKIALISNFINEKEKEFQDKYSDIDNTFENTKLELDDIINTFALQKYPDSNEKQMKYCKDNTHNRELYEKSDEAENVNNDLKIGKDDDQILHKLQDLNNELNDKIKELKAKVELDNKINELKGKIESKEIDIDGIKKELEKIDIDDVTDNVLNNVVHNVIGNAKKELEGIKLQNESREKTELNNKMSGLKETVELNNKINELKGKIKSKEIGIDDIKKELEEMKLQNDFEQELEKIKSQMKEFDQLYYGRKNKFAKLKTNFLAALGNLDTGKVSICFRNIYANYMENFSDKKKLEDSLKDISDNNKIFWKLDPIVIKVGDQEKKYTFNEFFMDGFIKIQSEQHQDGTESNFSSQQKQFMGIINVVNKTEQKDEKNMQEIKVTEVEQYTPEYMLENLPFVLESFHCNDDALENEMKKVGLFDLTLKFDKNSKKSLERFIDSENLKFIEIAAADNGDDRQRIADRNEANHRYFKAVKKLFCKKADHIVENADLVFETDSQNQLQIKSSRSIQSEFRLQLKNLTQKVKDDTVSCLGKEVIINNLTKMDAVPREHFLFFCGDWICHSNNFLSKDSFLKDFKNIVKKRIGFACKSQDQAIGKLKLTNEVYNLLTAVTLLSGLKAADKLKDMDKTVIDEICFLITGKREDFSLDDAQLIMKATKFLDKSVAESIIKNVIENQDYKYTFTFINAFDLEYKLSNRNQVEFIKCIGNRDEEDEEIDFMSVIDKFNSYPDNDDNNDVAPCGKLNFNFMKKLMKQILQKYEFDVFPTAQQKEALGKFLKKFIVDNDEFEKNKHEVSDFFKVLMEKVPHEKSKDVTKEIIRICSNLREKSQRTAILKYTLDASNNCIKDLELLEVLRQYNFKIEPMQLNCSLIEEQIRDIINRPLPLTEEGVQRLDFFCANTKPEKLIFPHDQGDFFSDLIDKLPEGSMSMEMFFNLTTNFFPTIIEKAESSEITHPVLALNAFNPYNKCYTLKRLAYALPQGKLVSIVALHRYEKNTYFDWRDELDVYIDNQGFVWWPRRNPYSPFSIDKYINKYQEKLKTERRKDKKLAIKILQSEKVSGMIKLFSKIHVKEIWTEFKQMYESAKERKEKNNNNMIITNEINWGENINEKINENEPDTNDQKNENQKNSQVINVSNITNTNTNTNINNNNIINNPEENQPHESGNPYTLSAWFGFLPIVPAIIFGVKTQHKLTGGDIALIIVGLFPIISAIVFGIMALVYNQNNRYTETQESLKGAGNMNKYGIHPNTNKEIQINRPGSVIGDKNKIQNEH